MMTVICYQDQRDAAFNQGYRQRLGAQQANALRTSQPRTHSEKLADALAFLGERWVLHPVNRVRRMPIFLGTIHARA